MSTELATMGSNALILDENIMVSMYKLAEMMASSRVTVPDHLKNSPGDCMAICMQSAQWGMNPFSVAQKTHLVGGNLGYEAQLVNAVVSSSKAVKGRFKYEYKDWHPAQETRSKKGGGTYKVDTEAGLVRVGAVLAGETEITWGEWLNTALVTTKNSPLWNTAPKQQAAYLATKYWARLYCPEVILGVYTADELDNEPLPGKPERDITPPAEQPEPKPTGAAAMLAAAKQQSQPQESVNTETGEVAPEPEPDYAAIADRAIFKLESADNLGELQALFAEAYRALAGSPFQTNVKEAYDERKADMEGAANA